MKLAAITDEISQDLEHALDVMLQYDVHGAELRGLWGTNLTELTSTQVAQARAALASRGMQCVCLATPVFKCDLENADGDSGTGRMHLARERGLDEQLALFESCCRLAHTFSSPLIRVFSFWRRSILTPAIEAQIVDMLGRAAAAAEREDVTIVLENEHACYIGTGAEAARIVGSVGSPRLKIAWDPGNAFAAGEIPYPAGYDAAKPWIAHVHVKDCRVVETQHYGPQPQWCVIGDGEIDYASQFNALRQDGYRGWISLETHYIPAAGSGPDGEGTPEDGSRPCLAALQALLNS